MLLLLLRTMMEDQQRVAPPARWIEVAPTGGEVTAGMSWKFGAREQEDKGEEDEEEEGGGEQEEEELDDEDV